MADVMFVGLLDEHLWEDVQMDSLLDDRECTCDEGLGSNDRCKSCDYHEWPCQWLGDRRPVRRGCLRIIGEQHRSLTKISKNERRIHQS